VCSMNDQLIRAEARELHRHRAAGGSNDYVQARAAILDRLYGPGAKNAVREYMKQIKEGAAE
jgi:hypothetical protein